MTDPIKPIQQFKLEQVESDPPEADDHFDFLDAAEKEVVEARSDEDKKGSSSAADNASEPTRDTPVPTPPAADSPPPPDPVQEAVKKRVFELLGKPQGQEQEIDDITEILMARGKDGTTNVDFQAAKQEAAKLKAVRTEIGIAKLPSKAALEIANIKENLNLANFKEAEAVLAIKGLGQFDSAKAAFDYMGKANIKASEIETYKELVSQKRIKDTDLGKLIKLGEYTRQDVLQMLAKESVPMDKVSTLLGSDGDLVGDLIKRNASREIFKALKNENVSADILKRIVAMKAEVPKQAQFFSNLSAAEQLTALSMRGADFDQRATIIQYLEKQLPAKVEAATTGKILQMTASESGHLYEALTKKSMPADLANEMLSKTKEGPGAATMAELLSKGRMDEKTARELVKLESGELRRYVLNLCNYTSYDAKTSEAFAKLATSGALTAEDADAYRDAALRLRLDAETILKIESKPRADRDALVGILKDQKAVSAARGKEIGSETFIALAKQDYPQGALEAIRQSVKNGTLSVDSLEKLVNMPEGYRAPAAALIREVELRPESIKRLAGGIHSDLLARLLTEKKAGRITSENINALLEAPVEQYTPVRTRLCDPAYEKHPLSSEALSEILKTAPKADVLEGYFKALDSGAIPSQKEFVDLLKLTGESRKAMEQAVAKGHLDAQALKDLQSVNFAPEEVQRYWQVLAEAKASGIDLAKLHEAKEYIQYHRDYKSVSTPKDAGPVAKAEIAYLLLTQKLDPESLTDLQKMQVLHEKTEAVRRELNLSVSESVEVDRFKRDNPSVKVDRETIDIARRYVSDRFLKPPLRDALGAASIEQQGIGMVERSDLFAAKDEVLKLARRHPQENLAELFRAVTRRDQFLDSLREESKLPFDKLKLTRPNDPELTALEISQFAEQRRKEVEAKLANKIPTDLPRKELEKMLRTWRDLEAATLARDGKNVLVELITAQPELAWQVLQNTPNEQLAKLSNDRFVELANSAKDHLSSLPQQRAEQLTRDLVQQFEQRFASGIERTGRGSFIRSWLDTAQALPSVISERKPAIFNVLKNLDARDMGRLSSEQLKQLTGSLSVDRLEKLPAQKQAQLLIDLMREIGQEKRSGIKDAAYKDILTQLKPEMLDAASPGELRWLSQEIKKNLKSEPGLTDAPPTGDIVASIARKIAGHEIDKKQIDALVGNLSVEDRALALELLAERAPHLSQAGFINQLKNFADKLRSEGLVQNKPTQESRGRNVEVLKLYCFNDTTSNRALSYQLKKHTGLQIEMQVLKPGEPLPEGKGVLIEPLANAPEAMRDAIQSSTNFRPATELEPFQKGLNFLHLAATDANSGLAERQLKQMLTEAKGAGRQPAHLGDKPGPTTDAEFNFLKSKVQSGNNDFLARTEAKSLLYFAHKQNAQDGPVQLHALVMNKTLDVVSYDNMIEKAWYVGEELALKAKPENTYFIVDEKTNSNHLATELYRIAREQEGREYDHRYITLEQAKKMKGEALTFVYLNDGIYSGTEIQKKIVKLQELKEATGAKVISASFIGYKDGIKSVKETADKAGVDLVVQSEYDDAYKKGTGSIEKGKLSRVLADNPKLADAFGENTADFTEREARIILGNPEWNADSNKPGEKGSGAKVVSALYLPYMRSNTTARLLGDLASYLDIPRAHTETSGQLRVDDVKAQFGDINDPKAQKAAVADLLKEMNSYAVERYSATMDSGVRKEQIVKPEDMKNVLNERIRTYLLQEHRIEAELGLENIRVEVEFGSPPGSRISADGKTLTAVLDPALAQASEFNKAKTEIMRQLLDHRARDLVSEYPNLDPARIKESVHQVINEKLFQVEHPLKAIESIAGISKLTEVSPDLLVGKTPASSKQKPLQDSLSALKERGVRTIIDIGPSENAAEKQWCQENGVQYKHMAIDKNTLTHEQADQIFKEIESTKAGGGKVYLQDRTGTDRTPAVVAAYRIAQGQTVEAAIAELASRFSFNPGEKTKLAKMLAERAEPARATPPGSGANTAPSAVPSPMSDEKLRLFIDRVENALPSENFREELQTRTKEFFSQEGSESYQRAVKRSLIKLDAALEPGQSKLTYTRDGQSFTPKAFVAEPAPGHFQTESGNSFPLDECKIEISISARATAQDAAAAAATEFNRLSLELQNNGKGGTVERLKEGEAALTSLKERLKTVRAGGDSAAPSALGAQEIKIAEAVDLGGRIVDVTLTTDGVRIGNDLIKNEELVKLAIEKKQKQLDQTKDESERDKLAKELENLRGLAADVAKGETRGMREALAKFVPQELEAHKNPGIPVKARVAEGIGRASAYLMIATFVASLAISNSAKANTEPLYAPLKPRK